MNVNAKEMKYYFSDNHKYVDMPSTVYHFCSVETFFKIISSSTIRLSNILKSNDAEEVTYIISHLSTALKKVIEQYNSLILLDDKISSNSIDDAMNKYFNELSKNFYVICFSKVGSLLSQWARYANDATGVSIGFNTDHFVKLQVAPYTGYVFGQVVYNGLYVEKRIIDIACKAIDEELASEKGRHGCEKTVITDCINRIISTFAYYSVLYKNPFFQEEQEWRLIYNPFCRIRSITNTSDFFDRIIDVNQNISSVQGFDRGKTEMEYKGNAISSYCSLNFCKIKKSLIKEIIIGPASKLDITDKDFLLFLKQQGYDYSLLGSEDHIKISKINAPYRCR